MSVKEVAAKYGVNKSTIAKYAKVQAEEVQSVEVPRRAATSRRGLVSAELLTS
jgi:hypothetical protein